MDAEIFVRIVLAVTLLAVGFLTGALVAGYVWLEEIGRRAYNRGSDDAIRWCQRQIDEVHDAVLRAARDETGGDGEETVTWYAVPRPKNGHRS